MGRATTVRRSPRARARNCPSLLCSNVRVIRYCVRAEAFAPGSPYYGVMTLADEIRLLVRESLCSAIAHRRRLLAKGSADVEECVLDACHTDGEVLAEAVQQQIRERTRRGTTDSGRFKTAPE